jgi:16S rRNA (guanine527-N7)-methyltransferase
VLDSLNPVSLFVNPPRTALDVGSGAGFPGIPLAIVWPTTRWFLVESREKKAGFLEKAVRELGLANVKVVCARVEDLAPAGAGLLSGASMEAVFFRAVGGLPGLLETLEPITAPEARWVYSAA